ncbi:MULTISPECIES: hypothetical protein [Chitinophaga]|uniref:hypothetical protein n=2 Tax=Chitinophaga TaxID=79328 RepID=UPI000DBA913C|nr:hypothetical protein [Chitinophaga ginsengisegetis]MDR6650225.1 hypothetical protein [Chitinophaga ginsengisegetis]MDR6656656.1 hypothetical protein [Chitinophaga ginsengisegetis]
MSTYFKMMADRLLLKKLPEAAITQRKASDDDTRELCALMDNIPNAKSVAAMYQQLIRTGRLTERYTGGDPGRRWLEVEQIVLDRNERKKENKRRIIWMVVVFITVGIASYFGGVYLMTKGKHLAMQVVK